MTDLTIDQVHRLLEHLPFLGRLRNRAGTPHQCAKTLKEAQAREVMVRLVALDKGKQSGISFRIRQARLIGTVDAYLRAHGETLSTYFPEGS